MYKFNMVEDAIKDIKEGKIIIVVDDPDRENEGDLLMAAEKVTGEAINFMTKYGRGLICMPVEENRLNKLKIEPMVDKNTDIMRLLLQYLLIMLIQLLEYQHLKERLQFKRL